MDSFKRNLILLATFNIVISYMIIPANADSDLCKQELSLEQFNTETEYDTNYRDHVKKPIKSFINPHTKVYHKIINFYEVFMSPMVFCLWIYTNDNQYYSKITMRDNLDITQVWRSSLQELHTYIYINICYYQLSDDSSQKKHPENFSTPYGKAYHRTSTFYGKMYPTIFCSWINVDVNTDYSQITWKVQNADHLEIWRRVVQDIFICPDNIGMYMNLKDHLCFAELRKDGFNTNFEIENTENGQNSTLVARGEVTITTSHGKAYLAMLDKEKVNITSTDFCLRIYGTENLNKDLSEDWYNLKKEIINNTCLDLLIYDEFNISSQRGGIIKKRITQMLIKSRRTQIGQDYATFLWGSDITDIKRNSIMFCEKHSENFLSLLKKYYNSRN